jgi:hypothetical protein
MIVKRILIIFTFNLIFTALYTTNDSLIKIGQQNIIEIRNLQSNACNTDNCPSNGGYCKGERCICLDGYLTVKDVMDTKKCNYKQKQIIVGLVLESFGLIGFGHFYAGRIFYGFVKLILFYVIICYGSQFVIQFMKEASDTETAYYVKLGISTACLGVPVLWHLIDLYKWATNQYLDGNGYQMLGW